MILSSTGRNNSFFTSELTLTIRGTVWANRTYTYTAHSGGGSGGAYDSLAPGEQRIIPNAIDYLKTRRVPIPDAGGWSVGTDPCGGVVRHGGRGDMSGIVIGARTGAPGGEGQYGVFYNAVPDGDAFVESAWVDTLQRNEENGSNLALVNTGEVDNSPSVFHLEIYDGATGWVVVEPRVLSTVSYSKQKCQRSEMNSGGKGRDEQ